MSNNPELFTALCHISSWLGQLSKCPTTAEITIQFPSDAAAHMADIEFRHQMRAAGLPSPVDRGLSDRTVSDPDYCVMLFGLRLKFSGPAETNPIIGVPSSIQDRVFALEAALRELNVSL